MLPPERECGPSFSAHKGGADAVFDEQGTRTGGARMKAVVTLKPGEQGRHYRLPTDADYAAVRLAQTRVAKLLRRVGTRWKAGSLPGAGRTNYLRRRLRGRPGVQRPTVRHAPVG